MSTESDWFQQKLNAIAGLAPTGQPHLRVVWGEVERVTWEGRQRLRYLDHVDRAMLAWRLKRVDATGATLSERLYPPTVEPPVPAEGSGWLIVEQVWKEEDIGIERWFVEQLVAPDLAQQDWDQFPELGPAPRVYYEEAFYCIADHSDCPKCEPGCKGKYRHPDGRDVAYVQWLWNQLMKEPYRYDWNEVPPPEVVVQALRDRASRIAEQEHKKKEELEYAIRSSIPIHSKMFGNTTIDLGEAFAKARKF